MANERNNIKINPSLLTIADTEEEANRIPAVEYVQRMVDGTDDLSGAAVHLSRLVMALLGKEYVGKVFEVAEAAIAAGASFRFRPCSGHFNMVAGKLEGTAKRVMQDKIGTWDKRTRKYLPPRQPQAECTRTKRAGTDPIAQTETEPSKTDDVPPQAPLDSIVPPTAPLPSTPTPSPPHVPVPPQTHTDPHNTSPQSTSPSTISTAPTPTPTPAPVNTEDVDSKPLSPSAISAAPGTPTVTPLAPLKTASNDNKPSLASATSGSVVLSHTSPSDVAATQASLTLTVMLTDRFSVLKCSGGTPVPKGSNPKMTQGAPLAEVYDWEALYAQHASARDIHVVPFSANKHFCSRNRRRSRTNKLRFRPLSPTPVIKTPSDYMWLQHASGYDIANLFSERVAMEKGTADYAWVVDVEDVGLGAMFEEAEVQVEEAPVAMDGRTVGEEGTTPSWLDHLMAPVRWLETAFAFIWRAIARVL